jgi:hypothetical protein
MDMLSECELIDKYQHVSDPDNEVCWGASEAKESQIT